MSPDGIVAALAEVLLSGGARLRGQLAFCVHTDDDASRRFLIDLERGSLDLDCELPAFERASVRVYAFQDSFSDLLLAPERLAGHLSSGEIVVEGDLRLLTRAADLMDAPQRPYQARLRTTLPAATAAR